MRRIMLKVSDCRRWLRLSEGIAEFDVEKQHGHQRHTNITAFRKCTEMVQVN